MLWKGAKRSVSADEIKIVVQMLACCSRAYGNHKIRISPSDHKQEAETKLCVFLR